MTTYTKADLGTTSVRYCDGCEADVTMTLDRRDEYIRLRYFWACDEFSFDGDHNGERFVDMSPWNHTEDA